MRHRSRNASLRTIGARYYHPKPIDAGEIRRTVQLLVAEGDSNVLVVDDDPLAVQFVTSALSDTALRFQTASNGKEAVSRLAETQPSLILLDLMMPIMDGFEFLEQVQMDPLYRDIPIIILSALVFQQPDIERLRRMGQAVHVLGPLVASQLATAILRASHRDRDETSDRCTLPFAAETKQR